jgi:hypothetical protein
LKNYDSSSSDSSSCSGCCLIPVTGNDLFKIGRIFLGTGIALGLSTSWTRLIQ